VRGALRARGKRVRVMRASWRSIVKCRPRWNSDAEKTRMEKGEERRKRGKRREEVDSSVKLLNLFVALDDAALRNRCLVSTIDKLLKGYEEKKTHRIHPFPPSSSLDNPESPTFDLVAVVDTVSVRPSRPLNLKNERNEDGRGVVSTKTQFRLRSRRKDEAEEM